MITESAAVNELIVIKPKEGEQSIMIKSYKSFTFAKDARIIFLVG